MVLIVCPTNGPETPQPKRTLLGEPVVKPHPPPDLKNGQHRHLVLRL